ncbi:MAG: ABC transporter permease [Butyrivibrio sp.]|nr:ABC transporter permease [Butyrivibrio sp.]
MRYVLKKVLSMALTLFVVSICVFFAFSLIPGDPVTRMFGTEATPELIAQYREKMGLSDPLIVRYFRWLFAFLQGDMGTSYDYKIPVAGMLAEKVPITLTLAIMSFVIMTIISIPLGIYTAKHENGIADHIVNVINQIIMAIPPFFSGIIMTFIFGLVLKMFKPGGFVSYTKDFWGFIKYLILPAIAIALPKAAMATKLLRGSVIDEAAKDYTRTAYSRGNTTNGVLYLHVLKNAMIPVVTFMGMALADMVAGSIVIEQVFGIPGISRILLTSINNRDYPVVEAIIMGISVLVLLINLLVDIIYRIIDPRIEVES